MQNRIVKKRSGHRSSKVYAAGVIAVAQFILFTIARAAEQATDSTKNLAPLPQDSPDNMVGLALMLAAVLFLILMLVIIRSAVRPKEVKL
jgi:hypothetical protein